MTMTSMAAMTASIITGIWSTMPTEVMMESSENTASRTTIWMMTCQKPERVGAEEYSAMPPSRRSCSSMVPLSSKKMPPPMRMKSLQEKALPKIVTRGSVRLTIQAMAESSTRRMASARPAALLLRGQARGEDGDENEVVDAQHDLEHDQGAQSGPGRGIGDPREIPHGSFPPPCGSDADVMSGPPAPLRSAGQDGNSVRQRPSGKRRHMRKRAKKKEGPGPLLGSSERTAYSAASWMRLKPATLMSPPTALATSRTTSVMFFLSSRM